MQIEIMENLTIELYGFSGIAFDKDYMRTAFGLMDKMWKTVKSHNLGNKGINVWVYEPNDLVFTGVALLETPAADTELEHKIVTVEKYGYYKHIGPYDLIKSVGQKMQEVLKAKGFEVVKPYLEIYGHWHEDVNKLETELVMGVG